MNTHPLLRILPLALALATFQAQAEPPANKHWKLIFSDEFDGNQLDESKWSRSAGGEAFCWNGAKGRISEDCAAVDGQGHFVIKVTRDADGTYRFHHGIQTKGKFQHTYGYYETRARFSREPGWWGAVWLYGVEVGPNPFKMGQEIDMFEDFNKPKKKNDFAHNVHFDAQLESAMENNKRVGKLDGDILYRVSRGTNVVVDFWNDFHVVGVEWTPLEYVFYCDGKETFRLDYHEVPVTTQPMHMLISGCFRDPNRAKGYQGDYADAHWPDQLTVDYVRAYDEDLGRRKKPAVTLRLARPVNAVNPGDDVTFRVTASGGSGTVTNLLLFTNGRIRAEKAGVSATFTLPAKQLYAGENILIAMARDKDGLVGLSKPLTLEVRSPEENASTPYLGKPQAIPGRLIPGHYDEGGQRVAYATYLKRNTYGHPPWNLKFRPDEGINAPNEIGIGACHRGMGVRYTVIVEQAGRYTVTPSVARVDGQGFTSNKADRIVLELDGKPLTEFTFGTDFTTGKAWWGNYQPLPAKTVKLPAGSHVLRVKFDATPFQFGGLEFAPASPAKSPDNKKAPKP